MHDRTATAPANENTPNRTAQDKMRQYAQMRMNIRFLQRDVKNILDNVSLLDCIDIQRRCERLVSRTDSRK